MDVCVDIFEFVWIVVFGYWCCTSRVLVEGGDGFLYCGLVLVWVVGSVFVVMFHD